MTDRPILFSAPMVKALLAGTKTQTRRALMRQPNQRCTEAFRGADGIWRFSRPTAANPISYSDDDRQLHIDVGNRLWVREAWCVSRKHDAIAPRDLEPRTMTVMFGAGGSISNNEVNPGQIAWSPVDWPQGERPKWAGRNRPGMFMPRWASRLTLIVTDVRVQRVQEISRDDAIAEGLIQMPYAGALANEMGCDWGFDGDTRHGSPVSAYAALWDSINGDCAWDANPWVAAYTFRTIKANIDKAEP